MARLGACASPGPHPSPRREGLASGQDLDWGERGEPVGGDTPCAGSCLGSGLSLSLGLGCRFGFGFGCCSCSCSCGQEPALFHWAPGERRESVDQPAGSPAGRPAMFVTGQGRPVHEHPRTHANPERKDARRARTRGGLSFGSFSLATQRKGTRAARRAVRKLSLFASNHEAIRQDRGEGGAHGGPGPTLGWPQGAARKAHSAEAWVRPGSCLSTPP